MGRVISRGLRLAAIVLLAFSVLCAVGGCEDTLLLYKVRGLVLAGKWDEGVFDHAVFGD